jgi:hypothetical protein
MTALVKTLLAPGSRFGVLLASLALMLFVPFVLPERLGIVASPALFTVVLLSSLSAVADNRRHVTIGASLAIPGCVLIVASWAGGSVVLDVVADVVALAFLGYVAILILVFVLRVRQVDLGIVLGSVCVYLLAALMWGKGYALLEQLHPSTANGTTGEALQYFSFVTITTLGYGDIQPVIPLARMLSVLEAVVGQLYLVILVSRLVGLYTALESPKRGGG